MDGWDLNDATEEEVEVNLRVVHAPAVRLFPSSEDGRPLLDRMDKSPVDESERVIDAETCRIACGGEPPHCPADGLTIGPNGRTCSRTFPASPTITIVICSSRRYSCAIRWMSRGVKARTRWR